MIGSAWRVWLVLPVLGALAACAAPRSPATAASITTRPNVLIILADDLGYSDVGAYGGEIATPNIDRLAASGVRLTRFHAAPSCSPTRAMLMTGADAHVAGLGAMAEFIPPPLRGHSGFEGVLSQRVATLAERLSAAGYRTMMSGKWHLGQDTGQRPAQRGFLHSFALLQGAANHFGAGGFGPGTTPFTRADYLEDDRPYTPGPDFISSDVFADKLIQQLDQGGRNAPFFAYLAFTAPHSPLQAPLDDIARQQHRYDDGWAKLAQRRVAGMRKAGVLPGAGSGPSLDFGPMQAKWDGLSAEQRRIESRNMEVYAAMIERLDSNIGRVLNALDQRGLTHNTLIIFLSDNGAAGETADRFAVMPGVAEFAANADRSLQGMGSRDSFVFLGPDWASAISSPSRLFKGFLTEGGTLVPTVVSLRGLPHGATNAVPGDVRDIAATILDVTGVAAADSVAGRAVARVEGLSLLPWLESGRNDRTFDDVAAGFYGQASVRRGPWKLLRLPPIAGTGQWQLFNVIDDPGEVRDRSAEQPDLTQEMIEIWRQYAASRGLAESP